MKSEIINHLNNPGELERLYREDKSGFRRAFNSLYPDLKENNLLLEYWHERLNFSPNETSKDSQKDLLWVISASFLAGIIAKIPAIFSLDETFFYTRNSGFIVFPILIAYFALKNSLPKTKVALIGLAILVGPLFINLLPNKLNSDTLMLSCIHLILVLWCLLGYSFSGGFTNALTRRIDYLKYNGDLIVMGALILISGGILSGITINLFSLLGFRIEEFYFRYIGIFGLAALPIVATYLIRSNPQLVRRISPVIARIFCPLVLIMLTTYLVAIVYSGKDPYNDREFLLIFNFLLIGVMAIIFFSIAEASQKSYRQIEIWALLLLSIVTIIVDGIALSAIIFRISEWGITPNRLAVLGSNILILTNLLLVSYKLFKASVNKLEVDEAGKTISLYLPAYGVWAVIVTFLFPFIFGFK